MCGGDGHFARNCPSVPGPDVGKMDCFGFNGKGHRKTQCPTANPHLKGSGGGWQQKGGWGKCSGSKGGSKGSGTYSWEGAGKGKGGYRKGSKGGAFMMDLMGDQWGGSEAWVGSEQDWSSLGVDQQYLRSLNTLAAEAPTQVSDRFASLACGDESEETSAGPASQDIPIELLVKTNKCKRKGQRRERSQKLEDAQIHSWRAALLSLPACQKRRMKLSLFRQRRTSGMIGTPYIFQAPAKW